MNINNFVIDHVLRGIMTSTSDGSYMWSINQITEPKLAITSDTAEAKDALGTTITTFNRGKKAVFTANNSLFDLGLFAAQNGVDKTIASVTNTIPTPALETITYQSTGTIVLQNVPLSAVTAIYLLNGDGTLGTAYAAGTSASTTKFVYDSSTHTITYPLGLTAGTQFLVMYDYNITAGTAVVGDAVNFPKAGKFVLEVLGTDVCDPTTQIHAFLVFPNAKLDAAVDVTFTTDGTHPFTINCQQAYCDTSKVLYKLIVPEEA